MKILHHNNQIARQLVILIVLFSSVLTLILTLHQLYQQYNYNVGLIESQFKKVEETNKATLENSIWDFDYQAAELLMQGILRDRDIVYLEVIDHNGNSVLALGTKPINNFQHQAFKLQYQNEGNSVDLGVFHVYATLDFVYQHLIDTTLIILTNQAIKTFLVSLFILSIVWYLITRHLNHISRYTEKLEMADSPEKLVLNRRENSWARNDELGKLVNSINTMRQEIHRTYQDIEHQSLHDHLTGLPNRRFLEERLRYEILQSKRHKQYGALLFIDLDNFKLLNDSLGHNAGDEMLKIISQRLSAVIRPEDTLSRIGGDEFLILLTMLPGTKEAATQQVKQVADKIRKVVNETTHLGGKAYRITASIGIKLFFDDQDSFESILKHADNAMYQSKTNGRDRISEYHAKMQEAADYRLNIERKLLRAIEDEEFEVFYQPKYNLERKITGAEALVRWRPAGRDPYPPAMFIGIAEESGLILQIGDIVIQQVFRFTKQNQALLNHANICDIAINVSPYQFKNTDFIHRTIDEIGKYGLDARCFTLEITEGAMIGNIGEATKHLNMLKRRGFNLSIDDFGTGYSSLRYLRELPVDELKIDQSFVNQIVGNKDNSAIISTIVTMAQNLGLKVVAEGVETEGQFRLLANLNCRLFQGYLFSKPVNEQSFIRLLEQQNIAV